MASDPRVEVRIGPGAPGLGALIDSMLAEIKAAREKFPGQEEEASDAYWLAVLVEEVGEAARAINDGESLPRLRAELIQVAAMAGRWWLGTFLRDSPVGENMGTAEGGSG